MSSKHQIAVPSAVRKQRALQPGDYLTVEVRGDMILLRPEPDCHSQHLLDLHGEIWAGVDPDEYLQEERESWQRPQSAPVPTQ